MISNNDLYQFNSDGINCFFFFCTSKAKNSKINRQTHEPGLGSAWSVGRSVGRKRGKWGGQRRLENWKWQNCLLLLKTYAPFLNVLVAAHCWCCGPRWQSGAGLYAVNQPDPHTQGTPAFEVKSFEPWTKQTNWWHFINLSHIEGM